MLVNHRTQHSADERRYADASGENNSTGNRIALVRQSRRAATAINRWFGEFGNFSLGVKGDIPRDLRECATAKPDSGAANLLDLEADLF